MRVALEDDGNGAAIRRIDQAGATTAPVAVRLVLSDSVAGTALDARLRVLEERRVPLWISIPAPALEADLDRWRAAIRAIVERRGSTLTLLEIAVDRQPSRVAAFAVQLAATEVRARRDDVRIALGGGAMADVARRVEVYSTALAPYVDVLALPETAAEGAEAWIDRVDPGAQLALTADSSPGAGPRTLLDGIIRDLGTAVAIHSWRAQDLTPDALQALAPLSSILSHEISAVDPVSVGLTLTVGSEDVTRSLAYRLFFDTETFATLLVYRGQPANDPLMISLRLPTEGTPAVIDLSSGTRIAATGFARDPATFQTTATVPLLPGPVLVNFNEDAGVVGERSGVTAERQLRVGEIIARHQRQQTAQDRLVRHYIADARVRLFFRPTITDPGYDIVTTNRYFVATDGVEWEETSFKVNNREFSERPPLPLVQPEEAFALPLQLRFDEGYTYELVGTSRVDGFECYEVRFEPTRKDSSLYRGTVWIDRVTFARIRLQASQGGLPGTVVSNDETLRYAPVATIGNQPVFLLSSVRGRQIVLIAGTNVPLDRELTFSGFRVNDEEFEGARASARESDRIMFRETPAGLRYYVKRDGARVVSDRPTGSVKAMAIGTVVDPSYQFPLPIFGINYIDFSFGNPDTQLAMLFAGVLAAGNIQRPQLGSARLDASLDFFAIAAPSSDRVYEAEGELESERVLTWPMSTGLNFGWQATPFQKLSLGYELRFDAYVRDTTTAESFRLPSSTITNGIGAGWEYSRGGYSVVLNATWYTRGRWEEWGTEQADGVLPSTPHSYAKYTASVSRDFFINVFQKVNVNGAWFGGRDLDRFVKYQFGLFDATRIHGVPAAVRFGELAMARGAYSVNVFDQYRLDLFLDHAWGREDEGEDWQQVPGIGAAFNLPGPWNTIVRADVGRSWLPPRYGSLGSTTLQIMLLKPMR